MDLKDRIKEMCKERNVSLNSLEQELGLSRGYLSKLHKSTPNASKLQLIADYFEVTLDYLMGKSKYKTLADEMEALYPSDKIVKELEEIERQEREKDIGDGINRLLYYLEQMGDGITFNGKPLSKEGKLLLANNLQQGLSIGDALTEKDNLKE